MLHCRANVGLLTLRLTMESPPVEALAESHDARGRAAEKIAYAVGIRLAPAFAVQSLVKQAPCKITHLYSLAVGGRRKFTHKTHERTIAIVGHTSCNGSDIDKVVRLGDNESGAE